MRTRGPDVDNGTDIGVISLGVINSGGTDSDSDIDTGGGEVHGVVIVVSGSDDCGDAGVDEVGDSTVEGRGGTRGQAQRSNSGVTAMVIGNPVDPRDDVGDGTRAIVAENLNRNNAGALGNATVTISALGEKGEIAARTKDQKPQFQHSGFRDRARLGSRI